MTDSDLWKIFAEKIEITTLVRLEDVTCMHPAVAATMMCNCRWRRGDPALYLSIVDQQI